MATERLSMRHIREILRQKWRLGPSHRAVAAEPGHQQRHRRRPRCCGPGRPGSTGPRSRRLTDEALEARLYGPPTPRRSRAPAVPDCAYLHAERRKPGVTLELLHLEYLEQHPDGYRYTQFCELYRRWLQPARA